MACGRHPSGFAWSALHCSQIQNAASTLKAIARLMSEYGGKSVRPILSIMRQAYVDWQQDVDAVIAQLRRRALGENVLPAMRTERRNS